MSDEVAPSVIPPAVVVIVLVPPTDTRASEMEFRMPTWIPAISKPATSSVCLDTAVRYTVPA
jgi:hypothetical protein